MTWFRFINVCQRKRGPESMCTHVHTHTQSTQIKVSKNVFLIPLSLNTLLWSPRLTDANALPWVSCKEPERMLCSSQDI